MADYNADRKVLKPELEAVRTARKEAKAAARDAHRILEVIEGDDDDESEDHPAPTTTTAPTTTIEASGPTETVA